MSLLSKYDNCNFDSVPGRPIKLDLRKVEKVYRQCQKEKLKLDIPTGSFIIKELAKACRAKITNSVKWRRFLDEIYQEMKSLNLAPSLISLNCMIDMYGTCHEYNAMFTLFNELKGKGAVDTVTFNCVIKHSRSFEEMMENYDLMKEMNIPPCLKTFKTLVYGLTRNSVINNNTAILSHVNTILADILLHPRIDSDTVTSLLLKRLSKFDTPDVIRAVECVKQCRAGDPENWLSAGSLLVLL